MVVIQKGEHQRGEAGGEFQWLLSAADYEAIIIEKGINVVEEDALRHRATGLLQALGMSLKLPQKTIATAQLFLHRFYLRESFARWPTIQTAPAIIFLAAKVEEHPRKLHDVYLAFINEGAQRHQNGGGTADVEESFETWRPQVLSLEKTILRLLCFDLSPTHPYPLVLQLVKDLNLSGSATADVSDDLVSSAWLLINDTYRNVLCLRYSARTLAAAAVVLAARRLNIEVRGGGESGAGEADAMFGDCHWDTIEEVVSELSKHCRAGRGDNNK